jgi:putative hydrolase of the HAD superfamily
MIIIFDLDDTLYNEMDYVQSGFFATAKFIEDNYDFSTSESMDYMNQTLHKEGRGKIFDRLLENYGIYSKTLVENCVRTYRYHVPSISPYPIALELLETLEEPLYVVTDGHAIVQQNKIDALGIEKYFKKVFITYRYGEIHAKPATYCFQKIKELENCEWSEMVYVGDDPAKDFVNLKPLGVHTIRVLTGSHKMLQVDERFDAEHTISSLAELKEKISRIC